MTLDIRYRGESETVVDQGSFRLAGQRAPGPGSNGWPFAGRGHELAVVVQRVRDGAAAVVLAGPAGVGKSRLAARVVADLGGAGWSTDTVRGTASARDTPYGALAHLLPAVMPAEVINPLRWAVDQVAPGRQRRRVLLVDDAHQLDAASAAVVSHLVEQRRASVVATVRTGAPAPDAIAGLWRGDAADRIELGPLSSEDTTRILRRALAGEVEPTAAERLWPRTGHAGTRLLTVVDPAVDRVVGGIAERKRGRISKEVQVAYDEAH